MSELYQSVISQSNSIGKGVAIYGTGSKIIYPAWTHFSLSWENVNAYDIFIDYFDYLINNKVYHYLINRITDKFRN